MCIDSSLNLLYFVVYECVMPLLDDLFGIPVKHNDQIVPAPGANFNLGHIRTPDVIGITSLGLGTSWPSLSFVSFLLTSRPFSLISQ